MVELNKMTHVDRLVHWFRSHNNRATLGEILQSGEPWCHEFNARKANARKQGYVFLFERGKTASENVYQLVTPEETGQLRFA